MSKRLDGGGLPMADGPREGDLDGASGCPMWVVVVAVVLCAVWLLVGGCVMRLKAHAIATEVERAERGGVVWNT